MANIKRQLCPALDRTTAAGQFLLWFGQWTNVGAAVATACSMSTSSLGHCVRTGLSLAPARPASPFADCADLSAVPAFCNSSSVSCRWICSFTPVFFCKATAPASVVIASGMAQGAMAGHMHSFAPARLEIKTARPCAGIFRTTAQRQVGKSKQRKADLCPSCRAGRIGGNLTGKNTYPKR